jgi:hypothetical protein
MHFMGNKIISKALILISFTFILLMVTKQGLGQYTLNSDSAFKAGAPNSGRIWGYVFGDYYVKAHSDSLVRGGSNQYTGVPANRSAFAFRRLYLGYDYNINKKFSAELLLAAEDNFTQTNLAGTTTTSGDLLTNNKLTYYIKLANLRWKGIWKGTDLVVGQVATPAFPLLSERIWGYRSIERTISDIRRTPSFDLGASLQGVFDSKGNYGYNVMVGNGTSAKPENDTYKWFYGDVFAKFFGQKLVFDLYADYERLNWTSTWHHSRNMFKGYVAYTTPNFTAGVEAFVNNLQNDNVATKIAGGNDTLSVAAKGISLYVRGTIVKDKVGFFARFDSYNPDNKIDNSTYKKYVGNTSNYNDPTTKESFFTVGLDFTPAKNIHFMPNVWYNHYKSQLDNTTGSLSGDYDLTYRMSFYYVFGK